MAGFARTTGKSITKPNPPSRSCNAHDNAREMRECAKGGLLALWRGDRARGAREAFHTDMFVNNGVNALFI